MEIIRFIPVAVKPKQGSRTRVWMRYGRVRSRHYTPTSVRQNARALARAMRDVYDPEEPYSGRLALHVVFVSKGRRKKPPFRWKETRPDIDNLLKQLFDAMMQAGWLTDDATIVEVHATKVYGDEPGVWIRAWPITTPVEANELPIEWRMIP